MSWSNSNSWGDGQEGWYKVPAAVSPPVPTYIGESAATGSSTTFTASTADIGNPSYIATRRVIVIASGSNFGQTATSATINGVSATIHLNGTTSTANTSIIVFSAVVPSGTTGVTIVLNMTGTLFGGADMHVYTVDNSLLLSTTPTTGANSTNAAAS